MEQFALAAIKFRRVLVWDKSPLGCNAGDCSTKPCHRCLGDGLGCTGAAYVLAATSSWWGSVMQLALHRRRLGTESGKRVFQ